MVLTRFSRKKKLDSETDNLLCGEQGMITEQIYNNVTLFGEQNLISFRTAYNNAYIVVHQI